jgi:hypothetical protein
MGMRKSTGKRKQNGLLAALEIQGSQIALIVAEKDAERLAKIRGHHMQWLQEATPLDSEGAVRELTAALTTLVTKEKIAGTVVHVSLSSEFCVTRVAAGESEALRSEVRDLHDRSTQYLSLGTGPKAVAESTRAIDAKHSQTWLTVANKQMLDNIVQAVQQAGLFVNVVEHSIVAMCRVVGQTGHDAARPVILIDVNKRGVDLGVCYRGELLFDYRPGGLDSKEHIAEIVGRHLERIQRYCNRQFRYASGSISNVFLCGVPEELQAVRKQFVTSDLNAEILDPAAVRSESEYQDGFTPNAHYVAPMGSLLIDAEQLQRPPNERGLADLMDSYRSSWKEPLVPALIKSCWPIAATILLAVGLYGATFFENRHAATIENAQLAYETELARIETMKVDTEAAGDKIRYLERIQEGVSKRPYHKLVAAIGQSLPEGVWLETIRVLQDGSVTIQGPSETEDKIFVFVEKLKKVPLLADVSLEGQEPVRLQRGPVIRFDIKCHYAEGEDLIERTASND